MTPRRPLLAVLLVVVSLGLVGAVDALVPPPDPDPAPTLRATRDTVISGRVVCPVGDAREGSAATLEVVHPGPVGNAPVQVELGRVGEPAGRATSLFPLAATTAPLGGDASATGLVTWQAAPLTVARTWRTDDAEDLPVGTAAGPCPTSTAATTWTLPGATTTGGSEARLRLANPHATGATVAVRFLTPEGPEAPARLRNVSIAPQETTELVLNEFLPERADLTVVVEVLAGRVAAEGLQLTRAAIGDVDGVSLLQAAVASADTWTIPWVTDTADRDPWLWVANDEDRTARVELTVHTAEGGLPAEGLSEVEVPPRTVRRVDLRGVLPEQAAAVTVRSDGVPVSVAGAIELRAEDVEATGFVVQRGAPEAEPAWTLTGGATADRDEQLRLVNPTGEPAVVDVSLWDGDATTTPDALSGLEVPAGSLLVVDLDEQLGEVERWAVTVRARSGAVVAGRVGSGDPSGRAHHVAALGTPASEWSGGEPLGIRLVRGTVQRLATVLGIGPLDPFAPQPGDEDEDEDELPADLPPAPPLDDPDEVEGDPADVDEAPDDAGGDDAATDGGDEGPQDSEDG